MTDSCRGRAGMVLGIALLFVPTVALGWGRDGHEIVAYIAQERLNPRAQAAIVELLNGESLADVANWADEIRKEREETGPWHYVNIPYEMKGYDPARDGRSGNNVIEKIVQFANILNDRKAPAAQRAEALKFLVHFVGDIHQPLHCAERNDDRGGNFRLVFFLEEPKADSLHRVWDTLILGWIVSADPRARLSARQFAAQLSDSIDAKLATDWSGQTPRQWADESHRLAVEIAYSRMPVDGPPPKIDLTYLQAADPVVRMQLSRAGVRLAEVLNRVFP